MAEEEKKNIFDKAFDVLGPRADTNELEEMKKKLADLEAQLAAAKQATADAQAAAKKAAADAQAAASTKQISSSSSDSQAIKRAEAAEQKVRELTAQLQHFQLDKAREDWEAKHPGAAAAPKFIAVHELQADETLSHLALKYYGHATPKYWKLIYEANKELIGDNPNKVRPGSLINIPELPEELKDK
jgi:nucleoid-associated protein YgaU